MTAGGTVPLREGSAISADGTPIGYCSLGEGRGLIIVGGVLSTGSDYLPLAHLLAQHFEVHVMDRRGRARSGPQRQSHCIDDECADLIAVAESTGATAVFGHSFGGLVALETARRKAAFEQLFTYEPGVPLRGQFRFEWLDGYQRLLESGDRRGAFAWMVKHNGFAPRALEIMPLTYVRLALRLAIRSRQWASMDLLLEANLTEHRVEASLDAPTAERFSTIAARTVLMGGTKSPTVISRQLITELAEIIPDAHTAILSDLDHLAPQHQPSHIATVIVSNHAPSQPARSDLPRTTRSTSPTPPTDLAPQPSAPRER